METVLLIVGAGCLFLLHLVFGSGKFGGQKPSPSLDSEPIQATPIAHVNDGGLAKVVGTVRLLAKPVAAKLSGRPCVFQEVVCFQRKDPEGGEPEWVSISKQQRDFLVEDETGAAVVWADEQHAVEDGACVMCEVCFAHEPLSPDTRPGVGTSREGVVMDGYEVEVYGHCILQAQPGGGYRANAATAPRIRIEGPDRPLQIKVLTEGAVQEF